MTTVFLPHQKVALAQVSFAKNSLTRADTSEDSIKACAEKWKEAENKNPFEEDPEPIHLFQDVDGVLHIGDGRTRLMGADRAGRQYVTAIIEEGTLADAIDFGLACNHKNGTALTKRDQTYRIKLCHAMHPAWSDKKVADTLDVSRSWVAAVRAKLTPTDEKRAEKLREETAKKKAAPPAESKDEAAAIQDDLKQIVRERQRKAPSARKPAEKVSDAGAVNRVHGQSVAKAIENIKATDDAIKQGFSSLVKLLDGRRDLTAESESTQMHHDQIKAALNTAFLGWEAWRKAT